MKYMLPWRGQWIVETDKTLLAMKPEEAEIIRELWGIYIRNRLSFFLAHSGAIDFINDRESDLAVLWSGVQRGKSYAMLAKAGLIACPADKTWPCFTQHGLKWYEWEGPKRIALASYEMSVHCRRNLWPKLAEILPTDELKEYSPHWNPREKKSKRKHPNWNGAPIIPLASGSQIDFYAYHQPSEAFTGTSYRLWGFDEQCPRDHFMNAYDRGITEENFQACMAATPHRLKGRPETGAGTWVHKLKQGLLDLGFSTKFYSIDTDEVPDAIVPKKRKEEEYEKYVDGPRRRKNAKEIREGNAKYYGIPESLEGLVYDNWDKKIQFITPFRVPHDWTRQRSVDPASVVPFATLWGVISPWGDLILDKEYYESGLGVAKNCKNIIEKSGNERVEVGRDEDMDGNIMVRYEEKTIKEKYAFTVMDGRTFSQPSEHRGVTLSQVYASKGLRCIQAEGTRNAQAIPIVKEWFEPVEGREHILVRMKLRKKEDFLDASGEVITAFPKLYVFNTLRMFLSEIEGYINKPDSDTPVDKDDHLMTALKYMILAGPRFMGQKRKIAEENIERRKRNKYTGW